MVQWWTSFQISQIIDRAGFRGLPRQLAERHQRRYICFVTLEKVLIQLKYLKGASEVRRAQW